MKPEEFIQKKAAEVGARGRRGVGAARKKLEMLRSTLERHRRQMEGDPRIPRDPLWPSYAREMISRAGWQRGQFQELRLEVPPVARLQQHPRVRALLDQSKAIQDIISRAQERGLLPAEVQQWDKAGRGRGICIDIYSFAPLSFPKLILVQVRRSERRARRHFLSVKKDYFVTDGEHIVKVPAARIKRAAALDGVPDSPLRAVRSVLPEEWRVLIRDEELRFPAPPPARESIVFKAVRIDDNDGTIRSLYDADFIYKLGKQYCQKARPNHRGGFYAYASLEEARVFARAWARARGHKVGLAILRCLARGRPIEYENGKLAFSQLKPLDIVEFVEI